MSFALPAVNDNCAITRGAGDPLWVADINSPTNTGVKANGSLPHPDSATEFDNNTAGAVKGYAKEFTNGGAGKDVSSDTIILLWHNQYNAPNRIQIDTVANGGLIIRIFSGTVNGTNYRDFYVGGNDTPNAASISGQFPLIVDLNDATHDASSGTFDNTNVTGVAILTTRLNIAGTSTNWNYQGKMYLIDTSKASNNTPTFSGSGSVIQDIVTEVQGTDYTDKLGSWVRQIGSVIFIDFGFRIGNNSSITTFDDEGKTMISPITNDPGDPSKRITTQACRVYLNLRNNVADTADFSGIWSWGTRAIFNFNQADSAIVTFADPTFKGMGEFTIGSSITGPATWDDVGVVVMADTGVDIDGSLFKNPNGNHLLQLGGAMNITDMRFESYASNHAILIDTAGTYNFDNVFFDKSGTNDIETTHASGTVTINISNGGTVPTVTETGAGSVVVNNNVTVKVTAVDSVLQTGVENARILLYPVTGISTTITRSGSTATATATAHGHATSDKIVVLGADQSEYNGIKTITVTGANTYTYTVSGTPTTPATGTVTSHKLILNDVADSLGVVQDTAFNYSSDVAVTGRVRKGTVSPYYKTAPLAGIIAATGFDTTAQLIIDE